jgi:hypothetical protein
MRQRGRAPFLGSKRGATDQQRQQSRDRVLPGPYFEGDVTLENTVQIIHQRPGTYRLDSIIWITAGRRELFAQQIPEDRIRILQEPGDPPNMSRWEVEHS